MKSPLYSALRASHHLLWVLLFAGQASYAQSASAPLAADSRAEVVEKIEQLTKSLEQTQAELAQSRTEIQQLRATLQEVLKRMDTLSSAPASSTSPGTQLLALNPTRSRQGPTKPMPRRKFRKMIGTS